MLAVAIGSDKLGFPASAFQLSKEPFWLKLQVGLVQLGAKIENVRDGRGSRTSRG